MSNKKKEEARLHEINCIIIGMQRKDGSKHNGVNSIVETLQQKSAYRKVSAKLFQMKPECVDVPGITGEAGQSS